MIFTSFEYILFFAVVLLGRSLIRNFAVEKLFLLIASYVFYMSWSVPCALLILATSLVDFGVGLGLERVEQPAKRKCLLIASIVANLGVLAFFKYTNFFLDNLHGALTAVGVQAPVWHYNIILPAGISFFTFQSMTYTIESYRRRVKVCHSPRDFLLFTSFFPQLLAGPINRAADLLPQFKARLRASWHDLELGLTQFGLGAVKKLVISDQIAPHIDVIFANPGSYDSFTLLQAALGYAVQIYCDFSGYSDMAIGSARMMGFRFMENFQMPYSAVTITEFWRRWHISLSTWLRDYLYIPLGGNRKGTARTYINLFITMLLGGLWHGASWNFVFWGALHGTALALHKAWMTVDPVRSFRGNPWFDAVWSLFSRALTLTIVLVGWIFFRASSWTTATQFLSRLAEFGNAGMRVLSPYILAAVALVALVHLVVHKDRNWCHEVPERNFGYRVLAYSSLMLLLVCLAATDSAPFIYFQF